MSTLNANPDASDTSSQAADGMYSAMSPENDSPDAIRGAAQASAWGDGLRCSVRNHPLTAVAAAATLGILLARLTR